MRTRARRILGGATIWGLLLGLSILLYSGCVSAHAQGGAQAREHVPVRSGNNGASPVVVVATPQETPPPQAPPENFPISPVPSISGKAGIVMDPSNREILYEKNIHEPRAVASTQKLLTALVALESASGSVVKVPVKATQLEPSKLYLKAGTEYEINYLVKALMVKSANDVAYTIAEGAAGSFQGFIEMMNARAARLGMRNSHFKNASGLTVEGQYSTAYDIALCASEAYQHPYLRECVKTREMIFNYADGRTKKLENTNELLQSIPYCTGMKTGTTNASGNCLVSSGELNGRVMIVGVFGCSSKAALWKDSEALLKWALER